MSDTNERSVASAGSVASEPVAWAVVTAKGLANVCILQAVANDWASHHGGEVIPLFAAAEMYDALVVAHEEVARLRLTDAEQDAIEAAANAYQRRFDDGVGLLNDGPSECGKIAATLRGLLERMK